MITLLDKIKLKDIKYRIDFIKWVKEVDYVACHKLPSVQKFVVHQVNTSDCDFIEIVHVSSMQAFEEDMQTPVFTSLVSDFSEMAEVTEQIVCEEIPPGYVLE